MAVVGHRSCGKTSLVELLCVAGRAVRERGSVADGTSLLDHGAASRRHRMTTELATAWLDWEGRGGAAEGAARIQVLDTPGAEFLAGMRDLALASAEAAVLVVDAVAGVQVGTEDAAERVAELGLPAIAVVTRVDRLAPGSPLPALDLPERPLLRGARTAVLHLPVHGRPPEGGADERLVGVLDLVGRRFLRHDPEGSGALSPEPVPEALQPELARGREALAEAVALTDDALLEHFLEYLELPDDLLWSGLARAVRSRVLVPVLVASHALGLGAGPLLDAIVDWAPSLAEVPRSATGIDGEREEIDPEGPFFARVLGEHVDADGERWHLLRVMAGRPPKGDWFTARTGDRHRVRKLYRIRGPRRAAAADVEPGAIVGTWDPLPVAAGETLTAGATATIDGFRRPGAMVAWSARPARGPDRRALDAALQAVCRADPGLSLHSETATGALLLAGADEAHLRLAVEHLHAANVSVETALPAVGYVETPIRGAPEVEGVHVRTGADGLREEFGRCALAVTPTDPLAGNRFVDALGDDEDLLPERFRPAVGEGVAEAARRGPLAGYPVVGVEWTLVGGDYDLLQSTDAHFRLAGQRAARAALEAVGTRLLEPWWEVEVVGPQRILGDLLSDLTSHRGRILTTWVEGDRAFVVATCPYRELRTFGTRLRALSQGRARFDARETHYEPVPPHLVPEAIAASPAPPPPARRATPTAGGAEPV